MKKKTISRPILIVVLAMFLVGMLLCSTHTSPLFPSNYGSDSALFTLIGKGLTEGKILYKDLFDHKGPVLFFIEFLGYFLGKSTGIFLLQCVLGAIGLYFLYFAWSAISEKKGTKSLINLLAVFVSFCAVFFHTFQGGNLSEEYSLPFISLCIFLFVKYALNAENHPKHPWLYSLIYGIVFALLALTRLNNAITVLAGVFAIILFLIYKREYKNILINLVFGILGILAVALPVVIYFASQSALHDFVYATFTYNFMYATKVSHQSIVSNWSSFLVLYMPIICSIVLITLKIWKTKKINFLDFLIATIVVLNTACLFISNGFPHYFTIYVPVFALVLSTYFEFDIKKIKTYFIALCALLCALNVGLVFAKSVYSTHVIKYYKNIHDSVEEIVEQIPENERDAVVGFEVPCSYYLYADIVPCSKYYTHQEWWSVSDPDIMVSFIDHINSGQVLWVLTKPKEDNPELLEILAQKYVLVDSNEHLNIYRLKESE